MKFFHLILFLLCLCSLPCISSADESGGSSLKPSLDGYVEGKGIYAFDSSTPDENPSATIGMECKSNLSSWGMIKLSLQAKEDGKVIDPQNTRIFNEFDKIYQDKNPYINIDEAYLDIYADKVDFRLGIQKFAWGRLDEMNPTDNMNTEDLTEATSAEEAERKIGAPSLKATIYSKFFDTEIAWIPRYIPYRLSTPEERWFPPILRAPSSIRTNSSMAEEIPITAVYEEIDLPPFTLENSEIGVRIAKLVKGCDLSISYFNGYDPMPVTTVPTELIIEMKNPLLLEYEVNGIAHVTPLLSRIQVIGFDFTTTLGPFTLRGESAFFKDKYYIRKLDTVLAEEASPEKQNEILMQFISNYLASLGTKSKQTFYMNPEMAIKKNSVKYGIGIDYMHGDTTVSMQCIQEYIFDYEKDRPVYFNKEGIDTTLTLALKQFLLQNTLAIDIGGAYNIEFKDILCQPSVTYHFTDNLQGTFGALILAGKYKDSLIGQFDDNDEIFAKIRYSL